MNTSSRRDELARPKDDLDAAAEPVRRRAALRTLVDDWDAVSVDEKRRLVSLVFSEIVVAGSGIHELAPRRVQALCEHGAGATAGCGTI